MLLQLRGVLRLGHLAPPAVPGRRQHAAAPPIWPLVRTAPQPRPRPRLCPPLTQAGTQGPPPPKGRTELERVAHGRLLLGKEVPPLEAGPEVVTVDPQAEPVECPDHTPRVAGLLEPAPQHRDEQSPLPLPPPAIRQGNLEGRLQQLTPLLEDLALEGPLPPPLEHRG